MTSDLAEAFGRVPEEAVRPPRQAEHSAIAELVNYLRNDNAKCWNKKSLIRCCRFFGPDAGALISQGAGPRDGAKPRGYPFKDSANI